MRLTKFTHSCVRFDDGDRSLVIDPGMFSEVDQALDGAGAILITHEHPDHLDVDRVSAALQRDSALRVWAPASVAATLGPLGDRVEAVGPGETFDAAGFGVATFGGQHAVIHPSIPVIANLGYLVAGVYHPGDSFIVPTADVQTLLVPIHAPWSKVSEVIDFTVAVRAPQALPIHDSLLTPPGRAIVEGHVGRIGGQFGTEYRSVQPGEQLDL